MAFWVHVEKGYTIFIVYFSSFKSLESLESLARLLEKVLKSCETFKIQDFANAIQVFPLGVLNFQLILIFVGIYTRQNSIIVIVNF